MRLPSGAAGFGALLRARVRMARGGWRGASVWQKTGLCALTVAGAVFCLGVAMLTAALLRGAQGGVSLRDGLTQAALTLIGRACDALFFFLLAGAVPFVSATLFAADDLPLLLTTPLSPAAIVGAKLLDATLVNASQSVVLGLPALAGLGWACGLAWDGWLCLAAAMLGLLTLPPAAAMLTLLAAARVVGMRRIRLAVTAVSIGLGLAITMVAVGGASRAARDSGLTFAQGWAALRGGETVPAHGVPQGDGRRRVMRDGAREGYLPSAWVADILEDATGGHAPGRRTLWGMARLLGAAMLCAGLCLPLGTRLLASDAFLEPPGLRRAGGRRMQGHGRYHPFSPVTLGICIKDALCLRRDLILQGQIGTALLLFLVPFLLRATAGAGNPADNDLYGVLALGLLGLIAYMVTSIAGLSSVGLEGRAAWIVLSAPVPRGAVLRAKWLGAGILSFTVTLLLALVDGAVFHLPASMVGGTIAGLGAACFALSGLGVGLSGLFPRFVYENPAHRASVWAMLLGFVFASVYVLISTLIGAGASLVAAQGMARPEAAYAAGAGLFAALSLLTGTVPVLLAARRLEHYEWEH